MAERINFIKSAPLPPAQVKAEVIAKPRSRLSSFLPHFRALALYTALTLLFAWPVLLNLTQGTPGHFPVDRNQNLWNFWWFKRSLLETFSNPYQTGFLFYPYGVNLYLHTYSPYNLLVGLPLHLLFGLIPGYSLLELSTFILAPYGGYLLTRYLVEDEGAALVGGVVFGFCAYHYVELLMDQMNLVSLQWLPFFILFLIKTDRANKRRELLVNGGLASLFFLLNMMVDFYYAIYLVMFAGLYWLNRFRLLTFSQRNGPLTHRREKQKQGTPLPPPHTPSGAGEGVSVFSQEVRSAGQRILQSDTSFQEATFKPGTTITGLVKLTLKMGAIFGLAGLVFSPVLFATVRAISSKVYQPLENVTDSQVHSADLLNMWLPPAYLPTNRPTWFSEAAIWDTLKLNSAGAVMGYVTLALAIYALVKIKGLWFWGGAALFWLIIALGPTLRINGTETAVPLPYRLLVKLPIFNITRAPERFIVMAEISLAVLVAYAVAHLTARFNGWRRFASVTLVIALVYLELTPGFLAQPDKIGPFPFAQAIKAGNSPVAASQAILELPVTKHQNPDSPRMLYQIYHNRPIIGGYISRKLLDPYRQNDYVLFDFIQLRKDERDIVPRKTAEEWRGLLNYANMGYIVLYPDDFARTPDQQTAAQNLIDRALEKSGPFYQDDFVRVYQIGSGRLEKPVFVLTEGWNEPEIISRETGQVQRWLEEKEKPEELGARANIVVGPEVKLQESYSLQIEAASAFKPRRLQVLLNGVQLQEVMLQPGLNNFAISGLKLKPGDNFLLLRPNLADGYSIPAEINKDSKDNRKLRISVISMNLK